MIDPHADILVARRRGATLVQILVVLGIVTLLAGLLLPVVGRIRSSSRSLACLAHLRSISACFNQYASDNDGRLPYPAFTEVPWERSLAKYTSVEMFQCPGDSELSPATGSSYDWRDTGIPETTLAGEKLLGARGDAALAFDALPSWHDLRRVNVVRTDGSAMSLSTDELGTDLQRSASSP